MRAPWRTTCRQALALDRAGYWVKATTTQACKTAQPKKPCARGTTGPSAKKRQITPNSVPASAPLACTQTPRDLRLTAHQHRHRERFTGTLSRPDPGQQHLQHAQLRCPSERAQDQRKPHGGDVHQRRQHRAQQRRPARAHGSATQAPGAMHGDGPRHINNKQTARPPGALPWADHRPGPMRATYQAVVCRCCYCASPQQGAHRH